MAKKSLNVIKNWFKTGLFPTQPQFWDTWDSFFHKDDKIPAAQVENLQSLLDQKIDRKDLPDGSDVSIGDVSGLRTELDDRVNKVVGKGLSTKDFTTDEKNKLETVEQNANNYQHPDTHPASIIDESIEQQFVAAADKLSWYEALTKVNAMLDNATIDGDTLRKLYDLIQTLKGNAPEAGNSLEKVYNLITGITNADKEYSDIASRDADKANLDNGESVIVNDATADSTVVNGWAIYRYNQSSQTFLKLAERESVDVDLSKYMKFTDLVTQYLDEPNKPAAASLVKELKDIVDGLPQSEADLDHDKLAGFLQREHLSPGVNVYTYGYSIDTYSNFAASYMNHGATPLTKLNIKASFDPVSEPDEFGYARWRFYDDNDIEISQQNFDFIKYPDGNKSSIDITSGGWRFEYGHRYAMLRLVVNSGYPEGHIYGYGCDQRSIMRYTTFGKPMGEFGIKEGEFSIVLAIAYFPDSENTKDEDVIIWNFTDLQKTSNYNADIPWYGVEWDSASASTECKRIGNLEMHKTLPIHSERKRCLVWDNKEVHYYTHKDNTHLKEDGTQADLSGLAGQLMLQNPKGAYISHTIVGTVHQFKISKEKLEGFELVKDYFAGALEASIERSTGKLCSVYNEMPDYRGGNNNIAWDDETKTLLGMPVTNLTRSEFRVAANLRGSDWHINLKSTHAFTALLYIIEYANLNSQLPFNAALTTEGYKQGGLGSNNTNANSTEWSNYNSYNPVLSNELTLQLGNKTGVVSKEIIDFGGAGVNRTFEAHSYRGEANIFGHIWKFVDGLNVNEHAAYSTNKLQSLADNTANGYSSIGMLPAANGLQTDFMKGNLLLPATTTGGTSISDYYWQSTGWRVPLVGGSLNYGSYAGLFALTVSLSSTYRTANLGSRLCLLMDD